MIEDIDKQKRIVSLKLTPKEAAAGFVSSYDFDKSYDKNCYISHIKTKSLSFYACFKGFSVVPAESITFENTNNFSCSDSLAKIIENYIETRDLPHRQEEMRKVYEILRKEQLRKNIESYVSVGKLSMHLDYFQEFAESTNQLSLEMHRAFDLVQAFIKQKDELLAEKITPEPRSEHNHGSFDSRSSSLLMKAFRLGQKLPDIEESRFEDFIKDSDWNLTV